MWRVREVDAGNAFVLPYLTETSLVVEEAQLLNDIIHDEIDVDLRFVANRLLVCFTQLADLTDIETLIGVELEHAHDNTAQLGRILLAQWRVLSLCNALEQIIQRKVFLLILAERTSQLAHLVSNAAERPYITLPVVSLALQYLGAHVEGRADARECFKRL